MGEHGREQTCCEGTLGEARYEIARSVARSRGETAPTDPAEVLNYLGEKTLPIYDPFAGGGSIPLEAQRLGLKAIASDLNPVAVLINKALIEMPPKFKNQPPVNPRADDLGMSIGTGRNARRTPWRGASGLADDIRYYGAWMRKEAFRRIGNLYPKAKLPDGSDATVIAWLWARTIPCPNPACGVQMPSKDFSTLKKRNNEHWIKPVVDYEAKRVSFVVQNHRRRCPRSGTVDRNGAVCIACNNAVPLSYVREQAKVGRMGEQMTAIVAAGDRRRLYVSPTDEHIQAAISAEPAWRPSQVMPNTPRRWVSGRGFGITHWHQLFTKRQLAALTTFSDLHTVVRSQITQMEEMMTTRMPFVHILLLLLEEKQICALVLTDGITPAPSSPEFSAARQFR